MLYYNDYKDNFKAGSYPVFAGQIGLFQRESSLDRVEHTGSSHDTPRALIYPSF